MYQFDSYADAYPNGYDIGDNDLSDFLIFSPKKVCGAHWCLPEQP